PGLERGSITPFYPGGVDHVRHRRIYGALSDRRLSHLWDRLAGGARNLGHDLLPAGEVLAWRMAPDPGTEKRITALAFRALVRVSHGGSGVSPVRTGGKP